MIKAGHLEIKKSVLIWKIDSFSRQCEAVGDGMESTIFQMGDFENNVGTKWRLILYPFGENKKSDGYLSAYLNFVPYDNIQEAKVEYCWELSILDNTNDDVNVQSSDSKVGDFQAPYRSWGWRKFIKRSDLFRKKSTLLKDDTLIFSLSLKEKSFDHKKDNNALSFFVKQYESLYLSEEFSDVTIVIEDKEIKVHKCILASRSKVFSAMLKHNMEESNTSVIKICDVDYDVMKQFLMFVYCGEVSEIEQYAKSLLPVSDKYDIIELKKICEKSMWDSITIDNACEIVCTADLYNCKELKHEIVNYIVTNIIEIITTASFHDLSNSSPALLKEILCELVKQRIR